MDRSTFVPILCHCYCYSYSWLLLVVRRGSPAPSSGDNATEMGCEAVAEVRYKELEGGGVVSTNSVEESHGRWADASPVNSRAKGVTTTPRGLVL